MEGLNTIRDRFTALSSEPKYGRVSFGFIRKSESIFSGCSTDSIHSRTEESADLIQAGCIAKLFTSFLVTGKFCEKELEVNDEVRQHFHGTALAECRLLDGVTIAHLLNHTHGLDCASFGGFPTVRPDGCIDHDWLSGELAAMRRLSSPGQYYSYNNLGAILCSALLEHQCRTSYSSLLRESLHAKVGIRPVTSSNFCLDGESDHIHSISPAVGGCLSISTRDLARFVAHWTNSVAAISPRAIPLPGWHPLEFGIYLGWKYYGAGWYGHNAEFETASLLLRCKPEDEISLVVVSDGAPNSSGALLALINVFGEMFPELLRFNFPRLLRETGTDAESLSRYCGTYENRSSVAKLSWEESDRRLLLTVNDSSSAEGQAIINCYLRPAEEGIFLMEPPGHQMFPFLQFIPVSAGKKPTHLWNGRQLWRRKRSRCV